MLLLIVGLDEYLEVYIYTLMKLTFHQSFKMLLLSQIASYMQTYTIFWAMESTGERCWGIEAHLY
jgi:hypothetical protein